MFLYLIDIVISCICNNRITFFAFFFLWRSESLLLLLPPYILICLEAKNAINEAIYVTCFYTTQHSQSLELMLGLARYGTEGTFYKNMTLTVLTSRKLLFRPGVFQLSQLFLFLQYKLIHYPLLHQNCCVYAPRLHWWIRTNRYFY